MFRIQDRLPIELQPLASEWVAEACAGRLGPALSDRPESDNRRYASVEELLSSYPPDYRPEGALPEALRLIDAKLDYLIRLMEEESQENEAGLPESRAVELGVDGVALPWTTAEGERPEAGDWFWLRLFLPGRPRIRFESPVQVGEASVGEADHWVDLTFANMTENEERVLSGYIFRRHREAVRRQRESGGGEPPPT